MTTTNKTVNAYNKFAKEYTEHLNSRGNFWNQYLEAPAMKSILQTLVKDKLVLDLGCGSGVSTIKLKKWGANVTGIDISSEMVELAKETYNGIDFKVGDIAKTGLSDNKFDVVSSSLVLHYIEDLKDVFNEVFRILKPGGKFVFSMHHPVFDVREKILINNQKRYLLKPYFNRDKYEWSMIHKEMVLDCYHHTFSDTTNNLIESGFSLEKVIETTPVIDGIKVDKKDYETTSKYPSFIIFISIKPERTGS